MILFEKLNMQRSEIHAMPFYEYEYTIDYYQEIIEERRKAEEEQQGEYENKYNVQEQSQSMMNQAKSNFKMPTVPNFIMPKI